VISAGPTPPITAILVVPGRDESVRHTQVEHREQARAVARVKREVVDEPASDGVVVAAGLVCQKAAAWLWAAIRVALFNDPIALTSLKLGRVGGTRE